MLQIDFKSFPTLTTPRLLLREARLFDAPDIFGLRTNDAVMQYIGRQKPKHMDEIITMIQKIHEDFAGNNGISWIITQPPDDKAIGTIGFWRIDKANHRAEIGYLLNPEYQGKGLMREAIDAALTYAFDQMALHSVEANVDPQNDRSKNLLLKTGFTQEAYFRENYFFDGQFLDSAIFSLLHHQFRASAGNAV